MHPQVHAKLSEICIDVKGWPKSQFASGGGISGMAILVIIISSSSSSSIVIIIISSSGSSCIIIAPLDARRSADRPEGVDIYMYIHI